MRFVTFTQKLLNCNSVRCKSDVSSLKPPWRVLFFGTDNFSLASLAALNEEYCRNSKLIKCLEVVTSVKNSSVRKYAMGKNLPLHNWPIELATNKNEYDIGLVVSFGHLIPKRVIDYFPLGMLNVHASLLPRWRGAAPIIYSLKNADQKTGVSIMKIQPDKFDTGEILRQEEVFIRDDMKQPELHDKLAEIGARNLIRTLNELPEVLFEANPQISTGISYAPKINPSIAELDLSKSAKEIYDLSRALSGIYPLILKLKEDFIKIHNIKSYTIGKLDQTGSVIYEKKSKSLLIHCRDGFVVVDKISISNKPVMSASDFNNGFIKNKKILMSV